MTYGREMEQARTAGVDGCPAGWLVATRSTVRVVPSVADVLELAEVIGIDMPIGLPAAPPRAADQAARRFVSPRGASVFPTLPRVLVGIDDYHEANRTSRALFGAGISKQAFMLRRHLLEVDAVMSSDMESRLVEVHPECSFRLLAGTPLTSKHTSGGLEARRSLVERHLGPLPPCPRGAREHDLLDAFAALVSAERFAAGEHLTLPAETIERDARGLLMRIVV